MKSGDTHQELTEMKKRYPGKFVSEEKIFSHIRRGDRIFVGTGCGEPQYLVRAFSDYVVGHPKSLFDAEILHIWRLGVTLNRGDIREVIFDMW